MMDLSDQFGSEEKTGPQAGGSHEIQRGQGELDYQRGRYRALNKARKVVAIMDINEFAGGRHKVDQVIAAKEGRITAMEMLGIAENRAREQTGQSLDVPTSLSHHSALLARHLQQRGLVTQSRQFSTQNQFTWLHPATSEAVGRDPNFERLPTSEVKAGRETLRGIARQHRKKKET